MHVVCRAALLLVVLSLPGRAQDAPYGDTYTPEELAALDRALEAGNLRRGDLSFDKAVTKGHGCLPVVREMLRDPLKIAAGMDGIVSWHAGNFASQSIDRALLGALGLLHGADPLSVVDPSPPASGDDMVEVRSENAEALAAWLTALAAHQPVFSAEHFDGEPAELVLDALRVQMPTAMAWHDVFEAPFEGERQESASKWREDEPAALHEHAAEIDLVAMGRHWLATMPATDDLAALPQSLFPAEHPRVFDTPNGRVGIGTPGDDVWTGDYAALIDPGGNDRYVGCRIGASWGTAGKRVGFFADLGGDDVYDCGEVNITLGAAVLGVAAFYDLGAGDDRYVGGHCSLGAAMGGIAVFYDDGGTDTYEGRTFTQGAAGFGVGIFYDDSVQPFPETSSDEGTKEPVEIGLFDNDRLSAWANAQAFARARGVAYCINRRGNDTYEAGGVYLHAPLFSDRYQSFSQGFAIGERGIDWAGGIAMLIDEEGNDRYLGDIYNQGVGYWYGAGLLWDGGGNDTYEMTQYGQGSGIHLAIGGLVDVAGHDTYVMHSGLGQGGSHDYAASVLHDRGGNDRYHGSTSCNGCGLTNSVGLHFDREGNDLYGARKKGGWNSGRPARDFSSIGVLVDLAGADQYMEVGQDEGVWRIRDIGLGIDIKQPDDKPSAGNTPAAGAESGTAEMPEIVGYEGELTQEVFDELWEISVRWEVGDNRAIVPEARKRLIAFGPAILPLLDGKVETDNSGLELRAFVGVLRGIAEGGERESVLGLLRKNAVADNERRQRIALHLVGELKTKELEDEVVVILKTGESALARRAADALRKIDSHAGDEALIGWLSTGDARMKQTAVGALVGGEADCWDALAPLLDHDDFSIRTRLVTVLGKHLPAYVDGVLTSLGEGHGLRVRRCALDVLARSKAPPDARTLATVQALLEHRISYLRADAARVVRAWERLEGLEGLEGLDPVSLEPLLAAVEWLATNDPDPFVRAAAANPD